MLCAVHRTAIYPVASVIRHSNHRGQIEIYQVYSVTHCSNNQVKSYKSWVYEGGGVLDWSIWTVNNFVFYKRGLCVWSNQTEPITNKFVVSTKDNCLEIIFPHQLSSCLLY